MVYWRVVGLAAGLAVCFAAGLTFAVWAGAKAPDSAAGAAAAGNVIPTPASPANPPSSGLPKSGAPARPPAAASGILPISALQGQGASGCNGPSCQASSAPQAYGTSVQFVHSPAEAARQARQEDKLLFVLHLSGNIEEAKFT